MSAKQVRQSKPRKDRQGKHCMVLELEPADRELLENLVKRFEKVVTNPSRAWVLRQLIRNAHKATKLPPVITTDG